MSPKGQERCRERPDLTWGPSSSVMGLQAAASLAESSRLCTALPDKETEAQREPGRCKTRQQVQGMLGAELGSLPTDRSTWDPFRSGVGPRGGQERRGLGWSRGGRVRSRRQISKILNEVTGTTFPDHNDTHMGTRIRPPASSWILFRSRVPTPERRDPQTSAPCVLWETFHSWSPAPSLRPWPSHLPSPSSSFPTCEAGVPAGWRLLQATQLLADGSSDPEAFASV